MFKKLIFLIGLIAVLIGLLFIRTHTAAPVNQTSTTSTDSSEYTMVDYTITSMKGKQYYGKGDDGSEIHFSADKILSDVTIHVNDKVVCYFDKNNLGNGIVKVDKK